MTGFKKGDRVRVTYEATYESSSPRGGGLLEEGHFVLLDGSSRYQATVPASATVELIEPAPPTGAEADPLGTVRVLTAHGRKIFGTKPALTGVYVRSDNNSYPWLGLEAWSGLTHYLADEYTEIVGTLPGSPANDRARSERPLWTGDSSEEPPEYVRVVRGENDDTYPYLVRHTNGGWYWNDSPELDDDDVYDYSPEWRDAASWATGGLTEVRD